MTSPKHCPGLKANYWPSR